MSSPPLSSTAKKNVQTVAQMQQQLFGQKTPKDRICIAIGSFFGSLKFIAAHAVLISLWIVLNAGIIPALHPFDPYPFPFLALIVGIEFIVLTAFVLMNQSRQAGRTEQWAHLNLQLAILSEHEITKNMQMLHLICQHLKIEQPTKDREVKELLQATPVTSLVEEIAQHLTDTPDSTNSS